MNACSEGKPTGLITVIVPVFQDPDGIRACLQGLARQTVPADTFEVVVVDNGSNPALSLPDITPGRVRLVRCDTAGSYAARNAGLRAARGRYLAFTDADCVPDARWLECGVQALHDAGGEVLAGGNVCMEAPRRPTAVALYQMLAGFQQAANVAKKGFSVTANLFCTRGVADRVGPFNEELLSGGDREWCWRAATLGIPTVYEEHAVVTTVPRTTLRGAIRQARRVAAGRRHLVRSGLAGVEPDLVKPHRGVLGSLVWIISGNQLGWFDRMRVLCVAVIIKVATWMESVRISLGGRAERR